METSKRETSKEKGKEGEFNTIYSMDEGMKTSGPLCIYAHDANK